MHSDDCVLEGRNLKKYSVESGILSCPNESETESGTGKTILTVLNLRPVLRNGPDGTESGIRHCWNLGSYSVPVFPRTSGSNSGLDIVASLHEAHKMFSGDPPGLYRLN